MKSGKRFYIYIMLIIITLAMAVFAYCVLPENVIIQFSVGSSGNNTSVPKLAAVLIPSVMGFGGAVSGLINNNHANEKSKAILLSGIGIAVFIVMIAVNCIIK